MHGMGKEITVHSTTINVQGISYFSRAFRASKLALSSPPAPSVEDSVRKGKWEIIGKNLRNEGMTLDLGSIPGWLTK